MNALLRLAVERKPDVIVCVDFGGFNSRFAAALRDYHRHSLAHLPWRPRLVQFVSPQVWASRPGRARRLARDFDRLLCILPFEQAWWGEHVPGFPVEYVGHPIVGRHRPADGGSDVSVPLVALMPGSRRGELRKHLPVMAAAARLIADREPVAFRVLLPDARFLGMVETALAGVPDCSIQIGDATALLGSATVALSKTGTITLECALHRLPTVTFYRTSPLTYHIGRRVVTVPFLSMPNLLAGEAVFPEFVKDAASAENLAGAVLDLLRNPGRRSRVKKELDAVANSLGEPGAPSRAARAVLAMLHTRIGGIDQTS